MPAANSEELACRWPQAPALLPPILRAEDRLRAAGEQFREPPRARTEHRSSGGSRLVCGFCRYFGRAVLAPSGARPMNAITVPVADRTGVAREQSAHHDVVHARRDAAAVLRQEQDHLRRAAYLPAGGPRTALTPGSGIAWSAGMLDGTGIAVAPAVPFHLARWRHSCDADRKLALSLLGSPRSAWRLSPQACGAQSSRGT